jgi:hypothetical protein
LVLVRSIIAAPKVQHNHYCAAIHAQHMNGAAQLMRINNASWSLRYGAHNSCCTTIVLHMICSIIAYLVFNQI